MNFKSIMMFLIAALTLLGVGAPALAAETAQIQAKDKEVSFNQCLMNGRLKFKDGKDGCLANHPTFLKQGEVQYVFNRNNFNLALSLNPAQCPAVYGTSWGNNPSYLVVLCQTCIRIELQQGQRGKRCASAVATR